MTNPAIIREGIERHAANSALIKLNQIGTVTETLEAIAVCRAAGSRSSFPTVQARPPTLHRRPGRGQRRRPAQDGAPARGERVAKYNRLVVIEAEMPGLPYGVPAA